MKGSGTDSFIYNDKYRYRTEKNGGSIVKPIKIIISKAESYDKIKEYFDILTATLDLQFITVVSTLDFSCKCQGFTRIIIY